MMLHLFETIIGFHLIMFAYYVALIQSIEYENRNCTVDYFKLLVKDWYSARKVFFSACGL